MALRDAAQSLVARPGRLFSQAAGMVLGAALFVVALGLGQTVSSQVSEKFDVFKATTVAVDVAEGARGGVSGLDAFVPAERRDSVLRLDGASDCARYGSATDVPMAATPSRFVSAATVLGTVVMADWNLLRAVDGRVSGATLNLVDAVAQRDVAVVGAGLARKLGVGKPGQLIRLGGSHLMVIGILEDTARLPDLMGALIVSESAARSALAHLTWTPRVVVKTRPGAGESVAASLALQLRPDNPASLRVTAPLSPEKLQRSVSVDVRLLSLGAAAVVLTAGVFAAANLMVLNVAQRTPQIGMRRALGASGGQIVALVLAEAVTVGLVAGLVGTVLGLWLVLGVCIANSWAPVIGLGTIWLGMAAGLGGGALGGLAPAIVAARIQPADALRR